MLLLTVVVSTSTTSTATATAEKQGDEVLPTPEKLTLSEYFNKRMRLQRMGQLHQRHTLLTAEELARDFANWDSESSEEKARSVKTTRAPKVTTTRASGTTTSKKKRTQSRSTSKTRRPVSLKPKKPLPDAIYSSSLDAMMMNRDMEPASSNMAPHRVVPINWEDELTEWEPPSSTRR